MIPRSPIGWQVVCALVGLAASAVPTLPKTHAFWGCNRTWSSLSPKDIAISDVAADSPAGVAGLRHGDQVVAIGDKQVHAASDWDHAVEGLRPGEEISVKVNRFAEDNATLKLKGWEPQREAIMFYDWQLGFAAGCAVFVILLFATGPLRPRRAIWRPILLVLSGLAAIAILLLTNWHSPWSCTLFERRWPVDSFAYPWLQFTVCLGVAILEVGLGAWEIRRTLQGWHLEPAEGTGGGRRKDQG